MITDTYYKIRKKFGKKEFSEKRIATYKLLYPEHDAKEKIKEKDERIIKNVLVAFAALCLVLMLFLISSALDESDVSKIERNPYGEGETEVSLSASIDGESVDIDVRINSKALTSEEIEDKFSASKEEMFEKLKGENESLNHIEKSVNFSADASDEDVTAFWQCGNYDLIDYKGNVIYNESFVDGTKVDVTLILSIGDEKRTYKEELVLYRPKESNLSNKELLESAIAEIDEESAEEEEVILPSEVDGKEVTYYKEESATSVAGIILVGIIAIAVLIYKGKKDEDDEIEKRKEELEMEYPELVSKLGVYIGAGLSVRGAWEKMVSDYKKSKKENEKRIALYEEMSLVLRMIESGKSEEESFAIFGERIGISEYLRLTSVLESNRKNGNAQLKSFLVAESKEAHQLRLQHAKRMGEKISSKLLIPMIMLFAIILIMLIIPAFMGW